MGLDIEHVVDTASGHTRRNIGLTRKVMRNQRLQKDPKPRGTSKNGRREKGNKLESEKAKCKSEERTSAKCERLNGSGVVTLVCK